MDSHQLTGQALAFCLTDIIWQFAKTLFLKSQTFYIYSFMGLFSLFPFTTGGESNIDKGQQKLSRSYEWCSTLTLSEGTRESIFIFSNFLENMLQPKSSKMPLTSTSDLKISFKVQRLIINMSHNSELRHRKKVFENFRKFIVQEQHIRILIYGAYCLYFKVLFK